MGGNGGTVEVDETYVGGKEKNKHAHKRHSKGGGTGKEIVFSLVENTFAARSTRTRLRAISASSKRGITGTYHHVSQQHLKRYLGGV